MSVGDSSTSWDDTHAAGVAEATAALEGRGLVVDALRLPTSTRLAFANDPSAGSAEFLVVETRRSVWWSVVGASSVTRLRAVPTDDLARVLAEGDGAALDEGAAEYPTNEEVRRVLALADLLTTDAAAVLLGALDGREPPSLRRTLLFPEAALRVDFLLAAALLEDLASGVPAEWAVRHLGGDPS